MVLVTLGQSVLEVLGVSMSTGRCCVCSINKAVGLGYRTQQVTRFHEHTSDKSDDHRKLRMRMSKVPFTPVFMSVLQTGQMTVLSCV